MHGTQIERLRKDIHAFVLQNVTSKEWYVETNERKTYIQANRICRQLFAATVRDCDIYH